MTKKQNFKHKQDLKNSPLVRKMHRMTKEALTEIIQQMIKQSEEANYLLLCCLEDGLNDKLFNKIQRNLILQGYDLKDYQNKKPEKKDKIFKYQKAWKEYK